MALALLLLVGGCGAPQDNPSGLVFAYEGSETGYEQAQTAAAEWNAVCGTGIVVHRGDGTPLLEVDRVVYLGEDRLGATSTTVQGEVVWVRFVARPGAEGTILHELGHALGIKHQESGLMSGHAGAERVVTPRECDLVPKRR